LPEVQQSADLVAAAHDCTEKNAAQGTMEHCGHEVLYAGGNSPESMMEAWFNSPAHKQALTYESSRNAGAAIVSRSDGAVVAAINIDY
jgi:hypothetical protein